MSAAMMLPDEDGHHQRPHVLITGVEFTNQGAFLMLVAASQAIRSRGGIPVVEFNIGFSEQCRSVGVYTLLHPRLAAPAARVKQTLEKRPSRSATMLRRFEALVPHVLPSDIDLVLDASGFCYGDEWLGPHLDARLGAISMWHERGVPVVFLPQAFGPFSVSGPRVAPVLRQAEMVFARDDESLRHVGGLIEPDQGMAGPLVRSAPDFTIGLRSRETTAFSLPPDVVALVPNWNIANRNNLGVDGYVAQLSGLGRNLTDAGFTVIGVCHEGEHDLAILKDVVKSLEPGSMRIFSGLDGLQLKGLIGQCSGLVAGRYHAAISALSQGVPTLVHGWSHKYAALMSDFECPDMIVEVERSVEAQSDLLVSAVRDANFGDHLRDRSQSLEQATLRMWDVIAAGALDGRMSGELVR